MARGKALGNSPTARYVRLAAGSKAQPACLPLSHNKSSGNAPHTCVVLASLWVVQVAWCRAARVQHPRGRLDSASIQEGLQ